MSQRETAQKLRLKIGWIWTYVVRLSLRSALSASFDLRLLSILSTTTYILFKQYCSMYSEM